MLEMRDIFSQTGGDGNSHRIAQNKQSIKHQPSEKAAISWNTQHSHWKHFVFSQLRLDTEQDGGGGRRRRGGRGCFCFFVFFLVERTLNALSRNSTTVTVDMKTGEGEVSVRQHTHVAVLSLAMQRCPFCVCCCQLPFAVGVLCCRC